MLEIVSARFEHDGAVYAFEVLKLFEEMEKTTKSLQVMNHIVENVLTTIQSSGEQNRSLFLTVTLTFI